MFSFFSPSLTAKDGYQSRCNECQQLRPRGSGVQATYTPVVHTTVKANTINRLAGNYKPEPTYHRETANKSIKSRGFPC